MIPTAVVNAISSLSPDTGKSATDFITNTASQTVSGKFTGILGSGESIQVSANGGTTWVTATIRGATWAASSVTLASGANSLTTRTLDTAGNVKVGSTHTYTLDTVAPTVSAPDLITADDTGISNTDNITSQARPTFTGTAEAGSTVTIFDGATLLGTATLAGTNWTFATTVTLIDGTHIFSAQAADVAGNTTASASLTVIIDRFASPTSTPVMATADDTGISNTDNITSQTCPTFSGTASAGSTVTMFDGAIVLGTATMIGTNWTYTVPTLNPLSDGVHRITAVGVDTAGNAAASAALVVTTDSVAPTISAGLDRTAAATGWFNVATGAPIYSYSASDSVSGLDANSPASGSSTFGEGTNLSRTFTVIDVAGNSASVTQSGVKVDVTAPTINGSLGSASPAASGWYNIATGAPTFSYTASDALAGLNLSSSATSRSQMEFHRRTPSQ